MSIGHHNGVPQLGWGRCECLVLLGVETSGGRFEGEWVTRNHIIFVRFLMIVPGDWPCPTASTIGVLIPRDVGRHNSGAV